MALPGIPLQVANFMDRTSYLTGRHVADEFSVFDTDIVENLIEGDYNELKKLMELVKPMFLEMVKGTNRINKPEITRKVDAYTKDLHRTLEKTLGEKVNYESFYNFVYDLVREMAKASYYAYIGKDYPSPFDLPIFEFDVE